MLGVHKETPGAAEDTIVFDEDGTKEPVSYFVQRCVSNVFLIYS